jgi:hypothetical protein
LPAVVNELWETILAYAKQRTVDPLTQLGRYIGFGVAGGLFIALGGVFLALGVLRAFQVELGGRRGVVVVGHGHLSGNWAWVPYGVAGVLCAVAAVILASRIPRIPPDRRR